ncbi:MAG TPA: hypothetical protein VJR05_07605 [Acidimicrobiia bacterium]|nr:hypothetical protein [Acidimicrobiia bacterium]
MQCRHRNCTCFVTEAEPFCSAFCRQQPDDETVVVSELPPGDDTLDCGCGHPACSMAALA